MPIPRIAIVGRPNVGKSSLLNMIVRQKVSIVDPSAGTTRDRVSAVVDLDHSDKPGDTKPVEIIDTGGFGAYVADGERYNEVGADLATLSGPIEEQIAQAVATADLILFCVDSQAGVRPLDEQIARMLREGTLASGGKPTAPGKKKPSKSGAAKSDQPKSKPKPESNARRAPVRVVATKVDGPRWESHAHELAALGFGQPLMCSATSNYFRRELLDTLFDLLPAPSADEADAHAADMRLAIIGKRNAGKSSLVNAMAGQKRVIVSEIAGTTRDAVDVRLELDGRTLIAIDTAGLRRKKSFANQIEWWAFDRAKRSIDRADVVLLLLDATEPASQVDQQLAMLVQKAHKPCVIVVNKWDLAAGQKNRGKPVTTGAYEEYLRKELKGLQFAPIAFVSAAQGTNIRPTVKLAFELLDQTRLRVSTGKLNRLIEGILERSNPPSKLGTRAKCYYVAQVAVAPPTIVMVVNRPELFTPNYQRFLLNRFREELPFAEVPIRLLVRGRKRTLLKRGGDGIDRSTLSPDEIRDVEREAVTQPAGEEIDADAYFAE